MLMNIKKMILQERNCIISQCIIWKQILIKGFHLHLSSKMQIIMYKYFSYIWIPYIWIRIWYLSFYFWLTSLCIIGSGILDECMAVCLVGNTNDLVMSLSWENSRNFVFSIMKYSQSTYVAVKAQWWVQHSDKGVALAEIIF